MSLLLLVTLITIFNAVSIQRICAWLFPSASFAQTVFLFITGSCVVSVLSITSVLVLLWRNLNKAQPLPVNWAAPLPWMFFPWALKGRDKINKMLNLAYPPFLRVLELSYQGLVSACLGLVVKYQVPDLLAEEEGKSIQDLAHLIGLPSDLLGRIMRVLLSQGLFKCEGKRWYNNYLSEILRKDHPQSFAAVVQLTGDEFIKQIAHFEDFLKEYPTRPESIASWSVYNHRYKKSFWEHLSEPEQQEKLRMFNEAMLCISRVNNEIYLQDFPWDEQVVMDIGGGLGGFLADILYRFPSYRGVLFDFEGTIQQAQQVFPPSAGDD